MVGDHIYLNIGGIFSLKPFNLTGIAGGLLFISLSFDEPLLKQYKQKRMHFKAFSFFVYIFYRFNISSGIFTEYSLHQSEIPVSLSN